MSINVVFEEFSPKDPDEVLILSMDFTNILGGETITACTWTSAVDTGIDASANTMISGACDVSASPVVKQKVIGGVDQVVYHLKAAAITNSAPPRTLVGTGVLRLFVGA